MPDIIRLLPDSVANKIAAGEVIQRPASAVKELLENAVDAGASDIKLIIKDAGKTLIQVVDDGCGMSVTDARMSFERHATSKIKNADDLFKIRTMGFRGEALASVAAISQIEVKTKRIEDELGTIINIEGSKVINQQACSCPNGTSISVKNLFFNVPARRNFLKSDQVETRHIIEEFHRVALVNQNISFSFFHNNKEIFHLNKTELKQRIVALFGNHYNQRIIPVEQKSDSITITGFIGKPEYARKTRGEQYFFANNRYIKQPYLHHAVVNSYEGLIAENSYPSYFIYIDVDTTSIDVNIHPTKTEVKFQDERIIYAFIKSTVKRSLGKFNITPSIDFDTEQSVDYKHMPSNYQAKPPEIKVDPDYNPFESGKFSLKPQLSQREISNKQNWNKLFEKTDHKTDTEKSFTLDQKEISKEKDISDEFDQKDSIELYKTLQVHNKYILTQLPSGIMIIDQRRAHIKILFEKFYRHLEKSKNLSQQNLFPVTISLSYSDAEVVKEITDDINLLGFSISESEEKENSFIISGTPADISKPDVKDFIESFLENYKRNLVEYNLDKRINLAASMAVNMAIKYGKRLEQEEMSTLIGQLFACQSPEVGHDGKVILRILKKEDIDNWF